MPLPAPLPSALLDWCREHQPDMLACLEAWAACETPTLEPERVRALAQAVGACFAAAGCTVIEHAAALELRLPGSEATLAPLLLLGHLDTVYEVGTLARMPLRQQARPAFAGGSGQSFSPARELDLGGTPFPGLDLASAKSTRPSQREGDRLYGPGVYDMKGGIVQALFALRALAAAGAGPRRPLQLLWVFDEETGSCQSRPLTEAAGREAAAALVLEPGADADGKLKVARKGIAVYQLKAVGQAAHAGVDFAAGASAIVELAARIGEVAAWSDRERGITVNPGIIAGGSRVNVVAAEAEAAIEARAWSSADLAEIDRRMQGLRAADARVRLEVSGGVNRPPMEATSASLALAAQAQRLGAALGLHLETARTGGGSDGNFTAALGTPTLDGLGMAGGGAHTPQEHILVSDLAPRTALLAALLAEL